MRELFLVAIVALLCPVSVLYPRIGLYAYTWFALMHPDALAWSVGRWPLSPALAYCTLAGTLLREVVNVAVWFKNWTCLLLLLLFALFGVSSLLAVSPTLSEYPFSLFSRVCLMALLIPMLVRTREHLREFTLVVAFSMGALGMKWGITGFRDGGARYSSSTAYGFLADNNCAALAFAMVVPLCWFSRSLVRKPWQKMAYGAMAMGSVAGIVWTHSRGGALSVAAAMLFMAARSQRKILVLVLLLAMTAPAVYLVRDSYTQRMGTLQSVDEDASARSRFMYWDAAYRMWKDHPVFGVGFGSDNFMLLLPTYLGFRDRHVVHNTYLQILADSGLPALLVYLALMLGTMVWLGRSAKRAMKIDPQLRVYPWAIQAALVAFAVGSMFLSRVTFDFYYILLMMAASWTVVLRKLEVPSLTKPIQASTARPRMPVAVPALPQGLVHGR